MAIRIDEEGLPWLFGRNEKGQLGTSTTETVLEPVPLSSESEFPNVDPLLRGRVVVDAACGRYHTLASGTSLVIFTQRSFRSTACDFGRIRLGIWK